MKATAIFSGGMDSATLVYYLIDAGYHDLQLISYDYGQRHRRELKSAAAISRRLHAEHFIVDISTVKPMLRGSALTDDVAVPFGHYTDASMAKTVVPGRNAIMLSIAWAAACTNGSRILATGVHSGDHPIYPDCRPEFIAALNTALQLGSTGHQQYAGLKLIAPFSNMTKTDIAAMGSGLGVPFELTWTCYEGQDVHCGECGACVERREAFDLSNTPDPTIYRAKVAAA